MLSNLYIINRLYNATTSNQGKVKIKHRLNNDISCGIDSAYSAISPCGRYRPSTQSTIVRRVRPDKARGLYLTDQGAQYKTRRIPDWGQKSLSHPAQRIPQKI